SSHPALAWPRRFIKAILFGIVFATTGSIVWITTRSPFGFFMLSVAPIAGILYAVPVFRRGRPDITLHAEGVVSRSRGFEVAVFDDVDEVWFDLERSGHFAMVRGLRLVDHDRVEHPISLEVENGVVLCNAVLRACSLKLLPDARTALARGETLTFGEVRLT